MHDSKIKNYCVWARRELIAEVERRCALFDTSDEPQNPEDAEAVNGRVLTKTERTQRKHLINQMKENGKDAVVEKAAYTWFNRIMAIRFMEVNDRLPSRTRMFSSNDGSFKPQILSEALSVDIEGIDRAKVAELVQAGDDEETFRYLFLAQCRELAEFMPAVFEKVGSDMELLLPDGLLRDAGVIGKMVEGIPEEDWREGVQIVGWMYQYYVSERKDEYFASKRKATRDDLAPATQLFTPEWIVRYLTENSLGRLWMLNHPESSLDSQMEYYIAPEEAETDFRKINSPEELTAVDPACGSGHILVYAFDLLAAMYEEEGYSRREIPSLILENNLQGLEIDPRAAAMASFALTMKACELDSRFLHRHVSPRITVLERIEFTEEERQAIADIEKDQERLNAPFLLKQAELMDVLAHLDEAGSLFVPTETDMNSLREAATRMGEQDLFHHSDSAQAKLEKAISELEPLAKTYDAVIANPPYFGTSALEAWAKNWVQNKYPDEKTDLFACFIERGFSLLENSGYNAMVTMHSWMFLGSYEAMRKKLLEHRRIVTMVHLGAHAFSSIGGEVVQTAASVLQKTKQNNCIGSYVRLLDFDDESGKSLAFMQALKSDTCSWLYRIRQQEFKNIPNDSIAYWASSAVISTFTNGQALGDAILARQGLATGENNKFIRLWWEVSDSKSKHDAISTDDAINSSYKWFPCVKGGSYRKWYGNNENYIAFDFENYEILLNQGNHLPSRHLYFKPSVSWTAISTGPMSFRYIPKGFIYEHASMSAYPEAENEYYFLGLLNSTISDALLKLLSPTINANVGDIAKLPILQSTNDIIGDYVHSNLSLSKTDYDSFETSWDYSQHPLIRHHNEDETLEQAYIQWMRECNERFYQLKANEEELNRIFAEIYNMQDEVPIEVPLDKVSVHIVFDDAECVPDDFKNSNYVRTKRDEVISLISYAIGCMMGRYSLDKPGLILANQGDSTKQYLEQVPNPAYAPDEDGIIPFTDVEYFHDDATGLFIDFTRTVFGEDNLETNLQFIADALGGEGMPRQIIRDYFRNGFFTDHCKTYSVQSAGKRPIYWLFDSGKKGGFRALFYMHRYTPDLLARLRTEYVHPQQERYRTQIAHIDEAMATADKHELADLKKQRKKLSEQLTEITSYEEKVHHLADQMIEIDLDDGVKNNYALFQDVLAKIK